MRIWIREIFNNKPIKDTVVIDNSSESRTHKVFSALEQACNEFDLCIPIWLDKNINDFKYHSRTKFNSDSFVEAIEFDYLDFQVLEED
ncbi:MAG: hypothetical protein KBS96_07955 [Lachnospiraceae bacterium]|nr:hypothetical protein [Candidatus Colinaster scatohippi]